MILISHRGNISGRFENNENNPDYIDLAISKRYDVEVDIWCIGDSLYLGHDIPQYKIEFNWILDRALNLWIHCKNIEALDFMKSNKHKLNYFWHQKDDVTITSLGHLWTYPGKKLTKWSIAVMPETEFFDNIDIAYGICSDEILKYKK
jgi:hypothetical protein